MSRAETAAYGTGGGRVRGLLFTGLAVAALVAVVAVPAASAKAGARVKLSVLPLPASSLGSAAKSLPLQRNSGVIGNKNYFAGQLPLTPNRSFVSGLIDPATLGRVSGYALDYGHGASGAAGVTEVWTSVDSYKTSADAKKGLASWKRWETNLYLHSSLHGAALSVTNKKQKAAAIGSARFAVLATYSAPNIAPLFGLDEQFTRGRYEADVTVWAGTAQAAKQLAPKLAKKLDARIKLALAGRLHAKPVKLPPQPKAGPPPGGPDLAPLALNSTDLNGPATTNQQGYVRDLLALSFYQVVMQPAGQFDLLQQQISWYATANEASFTDDVLADQFGPGSLDLSGIGDGAWGVLLNGSIGGAAVLFFSSGQLEESVVFESPNAVQPAQAKSIAQTVADKINQAGRGS
jgi:hypothetical protein